MELSTSGDVRDDHRLDIINNQAKEYVDEVKTADGERQKKLRDTYDALFKINYVIDKSKDAISEVKKSLGKAPVKTANGEIHDDSWRMDKIREIRTTAQKKVDEIQAP